MIEAQQQGGIWLWLVYTNVRKNIITFHSQNLWERIVWRDQIVQFVNQQLLRIRTANLHSPKILLDPNEKVRFIQTLEEDEDTIYSVLDGVLSDNERRKIALRSWTGCLCGPRNVGVLA
jgi:hypothetical protein